MKQSRKKGKHPWREKQKEVRRKNSQGKRLSGIKGYMKKITNRKMRRKPPIDKNGEAQIPNKKIVDRWSFF